MRIEKFVFGPVGTNCYIVINEMTSECFAVDMADCPQEFVKHIKDAGLCVKALLLTHGHFDHYMGADKIRLRTGCEVALSKEDAAFMLCGNLRMSGLCI